MQKAYGVGRVSRASYFSFSPLSSSFWFTLARTCPGNGIETAYQDAEATNTQPPEAPTCRARWHFGVQRFGSKSLRVVCGACRTPHLGVQHIPIHCRLRRRRHESVHATRAPRATLKLGWWLGGLAAHHDCRGFSDTLLSGVLSVGAFLHTNCSRKSRCATHKRKQAPLEAELSLRRLKFC
jgi:hypothetical protein